MLLRVGWREIKNKDAVGGKVRLDIRLLERYAPRIVNKRVLGLRVMEGRVQTNAVGGSERHVSSNFQRRKVGHGLRQVQIAVDGSIDRRGSIWTELPSNKMPD